MKAALCFSARRICGDGENKRTAASDSCRLTVDPAAQTPLTPAPSHRDSTASGTDESWPVALRSCVCGDCTAVVNLSIRHTPVQSKRPGAAAGRGKKGFGGS